MPATSAPSSNWAKLQSKLASSPFSSRKGKGKAKELSSSSRSSSSKPHGRLSGVASFTRGTTTVASDQAGPSKVTVDVPAPSIQEGVVFKPVPNASALLVELREMVAGRNALNDSRKAPGNYLAIDCEMVGLGSQGEESALARVSIVNYHGYTVLDTFVAPRERVTDWRTWVSGVRESDILNAPSFEVVQKQVAELVKGRVLVGHAIENDLKALLLDHPGPMVRDTQKCRMLRERAKTKRPGLKKLADLELGLEIQKGAHSSVTDARATMALYRLHKVEWEKQLRPATEAYKIKTNRAAGGKRKRDEEGEDNEEDEENGRAEERGRKKKEFPGGGRKGISSGLGTIIRKNGVRVDKRSGRTLDGGAKEESSGSGGNWWDE